MGSDPIQPGLGTVVLFTRTPMEGRPHAHQEHFPGGIAATTLRPAATIGSGSAVAATPIPATPAVTTGVEAPETATTGTETLDAVSDGLGGTRTPPAPLTASSAARSRRDSRSAPSARGVLGSTRRLSRGLTRPEPVVREASRDLASRPGVRQVARSPRAPFSSCSQHGWGKVWVGSGGPVGSSGTTRGTRWAVDARALSRPTNR